MASALFIDTPVRPQRVKKVGKPVKVRISPETVVDDLYNRFAVDMARLAE